MMGQKMRNKIDEWKVSKIIEVLTEFSLLCLDSHVRTIVEKPEFFFYGYSAHFSFQ